MRLSGFGWVHSMNSSVRLCLCLVLICLITVGATACPGGEPRIKFEADPLVLNDGEFALYTFVVKNATELVVIEAGDIIKQITNPSAATLKGTVKGNTTYAIRTGGSSTFTAILIARNESGEVEKTITLSFATEPALSSLIPPVSATLSDQPRSPQWGEQYSSPLPTQPTPSTMPQHEPEFAECPSNCPFCLKPDEAASEGFTQRCFDEPCYYSPDNAEQWHCYRDPEGWCCRDTQVSQTTKTQCAQMGGYWSTNEAEVRQVCQPIGWCCRDGSLYESTQSQCAQMGGTYWSTNQAEAMQVCQPVGWCCRDGNLFKATHAQCAQTGGSYWSTNQAEAMRACQQTTTCWCCVGGKVFQTTPSQCAQTGGACYATPAGAERACHQVPPTQGDLY
jgi:hypothetical protein